MKIGITGSRGFLGKNVSEYFISHGYNVFNLDLNSPFLELDSIKNIPNLDWVFHFAAKAKITDSFTNTYKTFQNNVESCLIALEIARSTKAKFMLQSSYVYGIPLKQPIDENHPCQATNPYMASKILCEKMSSEFCQQTNIPLVIFRAFNIYGKGLPKGRLISDLLDAIKNNNDIIINDPLPKRDYLYISDYCNLLHEMIKLKNMNIGPYNVGFGNQYSNIEVANLFKKLSNSNLKINIINNPRKNDILECQPNCTLVKNTFNWSPTIDLQEGLTNLLN